MLTSLYMQSKMRLHQGQRLKNKSRDARLVWNYISDFQPFSLQVVAFIREALGHCSSPIYI